MNVQVWRNSNTPCYISHPACTGSEFANRSILTREWRWIIDWRRCGFVCCTCVSSFTQNRVHERPLQSIITYIHTIHHSCSSIHNRSTCTETESWMTGRKGLKSKMEEEKIKSTRRQGIQKKVIFKRLGKKGLRQATLKFWMCFFLRFDHILITAKSIQARHKIQMMKEFAWKTFTDDQLNGVERMIVALNQMNRAEQTDENKSITWPSAYSHITGLSFRI